MSTVVRYEARTAVRLSSLNIGDAATYFDGDRRLILVASRVAGEGGTKVDCLMFRNPNYQDLGPVYSKSFVRLSGDLEVIPRGVTILVGTE